MCHTTFCAAPAAVPLPRLAPLRLLSLRLSLLLWLLALLRLDGAGDDEGVRRGRSSFAITSASRFMVLRPQGLSEAMALVLSSAALMRLMSV